MLEYNKNYITLVFNCVLKNSKEIIQKSEESVETIIQNKIRTYKTLKRTLMNAKE